MRKMIVSMVVLMVVAAAMACATKDPRYCDDEIACELAAFPYCDLNGELSGIKNNCIEAPDGPDAGLGDGGLPDAASGDAPEAACVPDSTTCEGNELTTCDSSGNVASTDVCPLDCHGSGVRCNDVEPSNGLASHLDAAAAANDVVLEDGAVINTSTGTVKDSEGNALVLSTATDDANSPGIFIIRARTFTSGSVTVVGTRALAIVSDGDIVIDGITSLDARGEANGPGAAPSSTCSGGDGVESQENASGGGGGGFATAGGKGGDAGGTAGGTAGQPEGSSGLAPLRGGCPGGHGGNGSYDINTLLPDPGGAGGAVQLTSRTQILFTNASAISANGAGGRANVTAALDCTAPHTCYPGEGGGSGGAILLEAPAILTGAGSGLYANGGGGSCYRRHGASGTRSSSPAAGADCSDKSEYASGGAGAAASGAGKAGGNNATSTGKGGGGGGGLGRIRINLPLGGTFDQGGATISPVPSIGTLGIR